MSTNRAAVIAEALAELGIHVWRSTRYANDTGTCHWCSTGTLVMVPDAVERAWHCQAEAAEATRQQLEGALATRAPAAAPVDDAPASTGPQSAAREALAEAGERLWQEGFDAALREAREMFTDIVRARFETVPPAVEQRIAAASFEQLRTWSGRVFTAPRAMLVVV